MKSRLELKVPPLALVPVFAGLMWLAASWTPLWPAIEPLQTWLPRLLLAAGALLVVLAAVSFHRHRTTVDPTRPEKTAALVTTGVYRVTRNPMYLGFLLVLLAWGVALRSPLAVLMTALFVMYLNRFQIVPEERALEARFGASFQEYRQSVRRWL